jgi:hypothetical protein
MSWLATGQDERGGGLGRSFLHPGRCLGVQRSGAGGSAFFIAHGLDVKRVLNSRAAPDRLNTAPASIANRNLAAASRAFPVDWPPCVRRMATPTNEHAAAKAKQARPSSTRGVPCLPARPSSSPRFFLLHPRIRQSAAAVHALPPDGVAVTGLDGPRCPVESASTAGNGEKMLERFTARFALTDGTAGQSGGGRRHSSRACLPFWRPHVRWRPLPDPRFRVCPPRFRLGE